MRSLIFFFGVLAAMAQPNLLLSEPNTRTAADSVITFNEIMYHPAGDDAGLEWLELYNQMSVNMDVSGWRIEGGVEFRFPANSVFPANSYLVIAADPRRMQALTALTNISGPFTNRLSNSGERLRLRNQSGRLLDEMDYLDEDPWPVGADGSGASLSKRDRFQASSPALNWRASLEAGGTPGRANFEDRTAPGEPVATPLVRVDSPARWHVPADGSLGADWIAPGFDDSGWTPGFSAIGYDTGPSGPTALSNVALSKKVIAGSGAYNNNPFDVVDSAGNFVAQNVTDGSTSDIFGVNYWLGRQGRINEEFTLDLGAVYPVEEIRLRNTHNTQHNDRGTGEFEIWASTEIDAAKRLVGSTRILRGRLSNVMGLNTIPADVFTAANGLTAISARYLRFVALTANNPGNNVGLNEIEVYAPAAAGPDRVYDFEGTVADQSGNGVHGQNMGARFSTNVPPALGVGRSLEFDGISSQAAIPDAKGPEAYTIALWVKASTVRSSSIILRTSASGTLSSWSHQLRIDGSGRFEHYLFDGTGRSVTASATIVPGAWKHVAITASNNGTMRIFVDGVASGGATTVGTLWGGGNQWRLGSDAGNAPNFFHGSIDEVAIWHSVLEDSAIQALAGGRTPAQLGGFHRLIATDLREAMRGRTSAYLRIPFEQGAHLNSQLTFRARYADGYVAFLNGVEVLRRNAPATLDWNSQAMTNRSVSEGVRIETVDLTGQASRLVPGKNVFAIQALNYSPNEPEFLFNAELLAQPVSVAVVTNLAFSEVAGIGRSGFFVEIANRGEENAPLAGCSILTSRGARYNLGNESLAPGSFLVVGRTNLGTTLQDGDRLFLLGPGGGLIDAVEIRNRGRGRLRADPDAAWFYTSVPTPGEVNTFQFRREIAINEVMYHHRPQYRTKDVPFTENEEQWIELYNISSGPVDLTGWRLAGEVTFTFPPGTIVPAESYLVVARNSAHLKEKYPELAIVGNFEGRLSRHSAEIILLDTSGNPADRLRYHNSHPWPSFANGGGSSLELRGARADNSAPEAWGASDETVRAGWRRYTYRATAVRPVYSPNIFNFHEFRMGLLAEGEALIDNITVTELPTGSPARQLLQNTDFSTGTQAWRLLGNHSHSKVVEGALHLVATGNKSYLDNRLETTLKFGGTLVPVVTGREYEISFDAKWLRGSPQLRTELYYNKVANTTILEMPSLSGTPGRRNSIAVTNAGPTYRNLAHSPVVPRPTEAIQVEISAEDPDGVAQLVLYYSVNGGAWRTVAMSFSESRYRANIPPQANGAVVQFYVHGTDSHGAISTYPAAGPASRALVKVDSPRLLSDKQTFRTIMTPADSTKLHSTINMMSDDLLGCTVVHHEREVFYDARIRLHGSMFSRNDPSSVGLTIKFPADRRFRGSRESVIVRRRGLIENIAKHLLNSAGGIPGNYDDVVHLVSHRNDNIGSARLNLANYDDTYIESQFAGDDEGTVFKLEGIREYQTTQNGNPEGLKLSQPIGWVLGFDIANLGDDPEQYRWGIMIQSDRRRDDYSSIVRMGKAFSLGGANLRVAAEAAVDVNSWARLFALQTLLGIGDVYGVDNPHNFALYARPSDGRVVALQNDWEFAFALSTSASIYGNKNVYKMLRLPGIQRLYQGHVLDLIESVLNSAYITPWAQHFTAVFGHNFNSVPGYLAARATSARSQLAPRIPFEITSNGGSDFAVETQSVTLEGRGWIDVFRLVRSGENTPLEVTWIDDQRWRATIPLSSGSNLIDLRAFNLRGVQVGADTIRVQTSASEFPQRDYLRISELMYHPAEPGTAERAAGYIDENDFEFVELLNTGPVSVSLLGVRFTMGIAFDFTTGAITNLLPGDRVLVVNNIAAFQFRYGTNLPVAGEYEGALSNSGERIRLIDAAGGAIHDFTYGDASPWPVLADGSGYSLEPRDPAGDYSQASNWGASESVGGSPGAASSRAPVVASIKVVGGEVQFEFEAAAGVEYEVVACEDLRNPTWERVSVVPRLNQSRVERVSDDPRGQLRFYRVARR